MTSQGVHPPPTCGSELLAVEVPGVYDGVLYWVCPDCAAAWSAWPPDHPRGRHAERYLAEYRRGVEVERARHAASATALNPHLPPTE